MDREEGGIIGVHDHPEADIDRLTSKQRAHLRALAHHLKPVVYVGTEGLTDAVVASLEEALHNRELLKVKLQEGAPLDAREAADALKRRVPDVHVPQVIGRTIVVYRPDPENPEISLPG